MIPEQSRDVGVNGDFKWCRADTFDHYFLLTHYQYYIFYFATEKNPLNR